MINIALLVLNYRSTVLLKIEKTIESLVQLLSENKPPSLSFANVNTWNSVRYCLLPFKSAWTGTC